MDREQAVDSKLTWDKVRLPPSVNVMDFDRVILSYLSQQWRKTARIVGNVSEHCASLNISLDPAIAALDGNGRFRPRRRRRRPAQVAL
jgi:hypothetical protein